MYLPPGTLEALLNLTTGAANTASNGTLVANPGASTRVRLWQARFLNIQNAAAQTVRAYVKELVSTTFRGACTFTVGTTGLIDLSGFGGVPFAVGNGVQVEVYDTLATQTIVCFAYYTLELA